MEKEGIWMALPIAIVEDQTLDAQRLEELLQQQLPEAECTWFTCGDDFLRAAAEPGLYAVVFLDICMAGTNGIETARRLRQADPEVLIVFVTSSPEYVWDAFPVHPFDYLLKPFKKERVMQTLERAKKRIRHQTDGETPLPVHPTPHPVSGRLMLHHKDGVSFLNVSDIVLVQREDRTTVFYTTSGERYVTSDSLSDTEARLDSSIFFRCHKSYIINLNHIKNITPYGRWTYIVHLQGTEQDALITHEKYEELEKMFS